MSGLGKASAALIAALMASTGYAGGSTVGNGGDAVVCRWTNGAVHTAEVLDLYEARIQRGIKASVPNGLSEPHAVLAYVLDRFKAVDPGRAAAYLAATETFESNAMFSADPLAPVSDLGDFQLKPDCKIEQFVIQRQKVFPEDKLYLVQAGIWQHLLDKQNALQLAAIMLHEVVYGEFLAHGATNSSAARYFSSSLFAGTFNTYTPDQYQRLLSSIGLPSIASAAHN